MIVRLNESWVVSVYLPSLQLYFVNLVFLTLLKDRPMNLRLNTRRTFGVAAVALATVMAGCASAPTAPAPIMFKATLNGASEVPPVVTAAKGVFTARYLPENGLLLWNMNYEGLSGPATMAHIHGPATETQNAGVLIGFNNPVSSPMSGQSTLTPAQFADLNAGKWYVNVHTAANRPGEIRGQLKAQ